MRLTSFILDIFFSLLFLLLISPIAFLLRIFRYDPLKLNNYNKSTTFWIDVRRNKGSKYVK